jgi:hypothetical protein
MSRVGELQEHHQPWAVNIFGLMYINGGNIVQINGTDALKHIRQKVCQ